MKVIVEVDLGSAEWTPSQVSHVIQRAFARGTTGLFDPIRDGDEGDVLDRDGNDTVGTWRAVES